MAEAKSIPAYDAAVFQGEAGLSLITERIGELLDNQYPALQIRASRGVWTKRGQIETPDKGLIGQALTSLGYENTFSQIWPFIQTRQKFIRATEGGWHLDGNDYGNMVLRRHIAGHGTAEISMRQAS